MQQIHMPPRGMYYVDSQRAQSLFVPVSSDQNCIKPIPEQNIQIN